MRIGQSRNSAVTVMNNRNTNICRGYENRYPKRNLEHQTGQMPYRRHLSEAQATEGYIPENIQRAMMVEESPVWLWENRQDPLTVLESLKRLVLYQMKLCLMR